MSQNSNGQTSVLQADVSDAEIQETIEKFESTGRQLGPKLSMVIGVIAATWSLYQLFIASPLALPLGFDATGGVKARAIHLAFGLMLAFLLFPGWKSRKNQGGRIPWIDVALAGLATYTALYIYLAYEGLSDRNGILMIIDVMGIPVPFEALLGGAGILLLLEATRRAVGIPLVIVASCFLLYSIFGQSMPDVVSHKGVSLNRLVGYQWLTGEAIFGIPIDVSVSFVFLFVLFGALLERAGAGKYFLDLAFAMVGRYRGGPAKAAILASGMTGAISGSSIANVVTTGTFTIPVMKKTGLPATKAGAIEVAASTNGQIMPPIMGAAAFIIAELLGMSYFEVVTAAFIPAIISYLALFYISHLEAMKLGLSGLPKADIPHLRRTFLGGVHFIVPIVVLVYLLMVEKWTAGSAVFWSIIVLMGIILYQDLRKALANGGSTGDGLKSGFMEIYTGLIAGARNMIGIAVAVATAGIIVGAVSSTGLNNAMVGVVETLSGGNVYILLILTAVLSLVLGMGLPTTANYLVVASLLAGVLVELGQAAGLELPLIAVHLFVFYFGLMADSTPPVCLAAFAASAISRADPLKTGVQSFLYDIRTAVLPFVFIFNTELLLIGVDSWLHGIMIFIVSLAAIFCFSSVTQGWLLVKVRWYEAVLLIAAMFCLFRPDFVINQVAPEYESHDVQDFIDGNFSAGQDLKVQFEVTRYTEYGERFKLFTIRHDADAATSQYGLTLDKSTEGPGFEVVDPGFNSLAEKAGFDFGDVITGMQVEQIGRPMKELAYIPGFLLIAIVVLWQMRRRKVEAPVHV